MGKKIMLGLLTKNSLGRNLKTVCDAGDLSIPISCRLGERGAASSCLAFFVSHPVAHSLYYTNANSGAYHD